MNGRILIIEDDERLANLIKTYLTKYEYDVEWCARGDHAEKAIQTSLPDLVILDVMLPGKSGFDICRDIQSWYEGLVLIMTASEDNLDEIIGLELGADDYLAKPVEPRLLLARVRALLRRKNGETGQAEKTATMLIDAVSLSASSSMAVAAFTTIKTTSSNNNGHTESMHTLVFGQLLINVDNRSVMLKQKEIDISTAEFDLLYFFAQNAGVILTRDDIYNHVRGIDFDGFDRAMDARISRLRKKLSDDTDNPQYIKTVRGKGYLFLREGGNLES